MSPRPRSGAALASLSLLALAGCGLVPGADAFTDHGSVFTGMTLEPGETAVIGLAVLRLDDEDTSATLTSLSVEGGRSDATAGSVVGVEVYDLAGGGGIGAVRESDLVGEDGRARWTLEQPEGAVLSGSDELGVVVRVRGDALGTWTSRTLVVEYDTGGSGRTQRFRAGAGVCVVADRATAPPCDPVPPDADGS